MSPGALHTEITARGGRGQTESAQTGGLTGKVEVLYFIFYDKIFQTLEILSEEAKAETVLEEKSLIFV